MRVEVRWMKRGVCFLLGLALLQASCGALVNGSEQKVHVSTIPPGATVSIGGRTFRSPVSIELDRAQDHEVSARLDGFEPGAELIRSRPDGYVKLWNCLFFLCIPQLWEGGGPSQHRLEPEQLEITLNPTGWSPR
jgi:PEGA domain